MKFKIVLEEKVKNKVLKLINYSNIPPQHIKIRGIGLTKHLSVDCRKTNWALSVDTISEYLEDHKIKYKSITKEN